MTNTPEHPAGQAADAPSLLAHSFPAWDLVPAHPLLLRRRPVLVRSAATPQPATAKPTPSAAPAERICKQCSEAVDPDSNFCAECGTRYG